MYKIKRAFMFLIIVVLVLVIQFPVITYGSEFEQNKSVNFESFDILKSEGEDYKIADTAANPSIKVDIDVKKQLYNAGETIDYIINVINDGNIDLENVSIKDTLTQTEKNIERLTAKQEQMIEISYQLPAVFRQQSISNQVYVSAQYLDQKLKADDQITIQVMPNWFIEEDELKSGKDTPKQVEQQQSVDTKQPDSVQLKNYQYPDTIELSKSAEQIDACRTYQVNLNITATLPQKAIDVILLIDRSASMNSGNPSSMHYAKNAAKQFAEYVLENPNNRVAIISYGFEGRWKWIVFPIVGEYVGDLYADTTINCAFSNDIDEVKDAIDNIQAYGGTNTQAGFIRARNLMQSDGRLDANRVIVMLTDGIPTVSINRSYGPNLPTQHNRHTISAYQAAQSCFDVCDVFTVGLLNQVPDGSDASEPNCLPLVRDTLQRAQNAGYYETFSAADLSGIYDDIEERLQYSAKNVLVTDVISEYFDLVADSFETNPQSHVNYNEDTHTITWEPGIITTGASLTYKIKAKNSIQGGEELPTNDWARMNYTDVNGNTGKTQNFPVPKVYVPTKIDVNAGEDRQIVWTDTIGIGDNLKVTGGYPPYSYRWTCDTNLKWESNLQNPQIAPDQDTTYTVTVMDKYGCTATDSVFVKVNKGSLTITKIVENEHSDSKFPIWIYGSGGKIWAMVLADGESATIEGLKPGSYKVKEIVPMNYRIIGNNVKTLNINRQNLIKNIKIKNIRINDKWFYHEDNAVNKFTVKISN